MKKYEGGLHNYTDQTLLKIYQFDSKMKKWSVIKSFVQTQQQYDSIYGPLQFITKGKLIDNDKEQLIVGCSIEVSS
ncbi:hypothetical protein [Domibacillus tundrae]|uniref:hypothetical protein n=1 Tax=Domibacillus tundrae TaxID=1587527 RepID=UPI00339371F2